MKKGYQKQISQAINVTDVNILSEVENLMRDVMFRSALECMTKKRFNLGAREAYSVYKIINS